MEDSTQNTIPWLESNIHRLVREAFEHFVKSGPESVAAFLMADSTQNTFQWLESYIHIVREAFEHFVKSGPESVAAFLEDSTQNTITTWLDSNIRRLVREAFEHFLKLGPAREQIQERDRRILRLRFQTSMPRHFFVGKKVEGRAICVKLIDATTTTATDDVVASGAVSSMTLDVVVLDSDFGKEDHHDWTWEHFDSKLEPSREGKGPLLEGDLQVPLKGGVGSLGDFKFTDISTCRRSGKLRLGVKVALGFYEGIRVREAITAPFEVIHFKKKSKEKHVPRALDDDVCTLMGIGKNGAFHKNLNDAGIFKVKDFLWKLGLDPEGLRKIVGKTMSVKNWKTLGDHAKESVPSGKYHVFYADDTKNYGIVFKNMSELCGLIEDGKYYSAETLSDNKKATADTLKKGACANPKDIKEYDSLQLLEMCPIKRARSSQTDVVTGPPEYCCSVIDQGVSPAFLTPVAPPEPVSVNPQLDVGDQQAPVPCQPPSVPSGEAYENSMPDFEVDDVIIDLPSSSHDPPEQADGNTELSVWGYGDSFEQGKQLGGSNSPRNEERMYFKQDAGSQIVFGGGNVNLGTQYWNGDMGVGNTSWHGANVNLGTHRWNGDVGVGNTSWHRGNVNLGTHRWNGDMGVGNTSWHRGNVNLGTHRWNDDMGVGNNLGTQCWNGSMGVGNTSSNRGNVNLGTENWNGDMGFGNTGSHRGNVNMGVGKAYGGGGVGDVDLLLGGLSIK